MSKPGSEETPKHAKQRKLRAREAEVDERAAEIAQMMAAGQWVTGQSHMALSKKWGAELEAVKHAAQRAGQALRVLMHTDKEELRARNAAHLEGLAADAHAAGEFRAAVSARDSIAKLLGLNAPEKHEHAVVVAQYEQLPRAGKAQWLRDKATALLAEADRLDGDE